MGVLQFDAGPSFANPEVKSVQRSRSKADLNLAGTGLGCLNIGVFENLGTAMVMEKDRLHCSFLRQGNRRCWIASVIIVIAISWNESIQCVIEDQA
jgi:hypothetical protein